MPTSIIKGGLDESSPYMNQAPTEDKSSPFIRNDRLNKVGLMNQAPT